MEEGGERRENGPWAADAGPPQPAPGVPGAETSEAPGAVGDPVCVSQGELCPAGREGPPWATAAPGGRCRPGRSPVSPQRGSRSPSPT